MHSHTHTQKKHKKNPRAIPYLKKRQWQRCSMHPNTHTNAPFKKTQTKNSCMQTHTHTHAHKQTHTHTHMHTQTQSCTLPEKHQRWRCSEGPDKSSCPARHCPWRCRGPWQQGPGTLPPWLAGTGPSSAAGSSAAHSRWSPSSARSGQTTSSLELFKPLVRWMWTW